MNQDLPKPANRSESTNEEAPLLPTQNPPQKIQHQAPAPTQPSAPSAPAETVAANSIRPVQPKDIFRSAKVFVHRLFGSSVEIGKKNVSYKKFHPKLEDMPHRHFFHTVDQRGKKLLQTDFGFGHFHRVEWGTDAEGNLICKSGPPMRTVTKKMRDGSTQQFEEPVFWEDNAGNKLTDNHHHTWEYMGSDDFTPASVKQARAKNHSDLAELGVGAVTVKPLAQARQLTDEDGFEIR